jgi:hypothetical protein
VVERSFKIVKLVIKLNCELCGFLRARELCRWAAGVGVACGERHASDNHLQFFFWGGGFAQQKSS